MRIYPREDPWLVAFGTIVVTFSNPAAFNDFQPSVIGFWVVKEVVIRDPYKGRQDWLASDDGGTHLAPTTH